MKSDLKPSLVMESSKDNYQVLFVCERRMESVNDDKEDEAAKQVLNASQETIRCRPERRTHSTFPYGGLQQQKAG